MSDDDAGERDLKPDNVIQFQTRADRDRRDARTADEDAHNEAVNTLDRLLDKLAKERCTGLAVAVAFADGSVSTYIPNFSTNRVLLIGAVDLTKQRLIDDTLDRV